MNYIYNIKNASEYSDEYIENWMFLKKLWCDYFIKNVDELSEYLDDDCTIIKRYFFDCDWNEVYDILEFFANNYYDRETNKKFMDSCNTILEKEVSAYRFVGGRITQITSEEEITEIEDALEATEPLKTVRNHLQNALDLFANKKSPDYRNSIKESISSVEAICKLITNDKKASLGQALDKIETKTIVELHPKLKDAFKYLYKYTSDAEGIRHALVDKPNLDSEDAKFMLVSCSAFVNYLIVKAQKANIKL